MTKTERLLDLARRIVRGESELMLLRAEFARLAGDPVSTEAVARRRGRPPSSLQILAKTFLDERAPERVTLTAIAIALDATRESAAAAMSKLVHAGKARRESPGLYMSAHITPPESTE